MSARHRHQHRGRRLAQQAPGPHKARVSVHALQRMIMRHARKWIPRLGLGHWRITYTWHNSRKEVAWCRAWTHQQRALLNFNLAYITKYWWRGEDWWASTDGLELLVIHELVHATAPSATEGAVQRIAMALLLADSAVPEGVAV